MIWPTGGRSPSKSASCRCGGSAWSSGGWPGKASMNPDFLDLLRAFIAADVRFLIVGAYALAAHGRPRATGDLDVWLDATPDNAARVVDALRAFGAPLHDVSATDFATPGIVYQIGVAPGRIDLLTTLTGVDFSAAWPNRVQRRIGDLDADFIGLQDFIANKRAVGRTKDLADIEGLGS